MNEHENKYFGGFQPKCPICGEQSPIRTSEFVDISLSGVHPGDCHDKALEYDKKRFALMEEFSRDKEILLKPLVDKFNADKFLLDKEYLKGRIIT